MADTVVYDQNGTRIVVDSKGNAWSIRENQRNKLPRGKLREYANAVKNNPSEANRAKLGQALATRGGTGGPLTSNNSPTPPNSPNGSPSPKTIDNVLRASPNSGAINPPNYYGDGERLYRTAQTNIVKPRPNFITVGEPYGDNPNFRTVGKPYSTNYPVPAKGTSVVPVNNTAPNFTLEGEPYSSEPNFRTVGKPYTPTSLPAEYVGTNVVPYTGNGAVAEPSLLSRAGNFLGNAARAGLRALPFLGAGYELFENNNPVNAAAVAGSTLSPLSLLFYSTDLADGTLTPEQLEEGRKYAEKVEQTKKEIAPFIGNLGHQLVGGESIIRDLPVDPLAGINRENKWTPNLTSNETKKVAAPIKKQQTAPATASVDSVISAPSDREQVMARRAAALEAARAQQQAAAATFNAPKPGFNPSGYATGHEAYYDPYKSQLLFR